MKNKLQEIILNIYRELYENASPKANFDELLENAELNELGQKIIPFNNYAISEDKMQEIVEKHLNSKRLNKMEKKMISVQVYLGVSPKFE